MASKVKTPTEGAPTSGERGRPIADVFARIEQRHPGIEEEIGMSSAALRAGQMVRGMRKGKGWTQKQLADLLGWDQERISNIERGEGTRGPTFDVMQKIAAACDHDVTFTPRDTTAGPKPMTFDDYLRFAQEAWVKFGKTWMGSALPKSFPTERWVVPTPQPQFMNACTNFVSTIGQSDFVDVEIGNETTLASAQYATAVPCIELSTADQRMIAMPVCIDTAPQGKKALGDHIEVKLYSRT